MSGDRWVAEVIDLHQFFARWLGGNANRSEFDRLESALDDSFSIIGPDGSVLDRTQTIERLRAGHGTRPGIEIRVDRPRMIVGSGALEVGSYEEWQREPSGGWRGRYSTAVLRRDSSALRWVLVQETWLPDRRP